MPQIALSVRPGSAVRNRGMAGAPTAGGEYSAICCSVPYVFLSLAGYRRFDPRWSRLFRPWKRTPLRLTFQQMHACPCWKLAPVLCRAGWPDGLASGQYLLPLTGAGRITVRPCRWPTPAPTGG
ncbi:hypothetical protein DSL92_01640 [Billgrantia gudaonensis]|uniref:Uncharacterized protein n=1 Tax=Billgrantia gudaonensis TaxID=376427 RepID=A0A3S0VT49_9GAMM|nr:hypothetical protein DSL92_01640 [Halomonas gudaonensis]